MDSKVNKFKGFLSKYSFIVLDFLLLAFIFQMSYIVHRSVAFVIMLILFEVVNKTKLAQKFVDRFDIGLFLMSIGISTLPMFFFYRYVISDLPEFLTRFSIPITIIDCIFFGCIIFYILSLFIKNTKGLVKKYAKALLAGLALSFLFNIYLPIDSFVGNISNFEFPIQEFIGWQLVFCAVCAFAFATLLCIIPDKIFKYVYVVFLGLAVAFYVQYSFLNGKLSLLGVSNDELSVSASTKILNIIVWIAIIAAVSVVVILLKKKKDQVDIIGYGLYLALHIVSCILLLVFAPKEIYGVTTEYYFDSSEQYVVSKNNNVIVIVFDCFDNSYVAPFHEAHPEYFDGLKDFTLYTDTCSVYDSTVTSMSQMFGGAEFDNTLGKYDWFDACWNSEKTTTFYDELHKNGYTCNCYNFEMPEPQYLYGKFDNLKKYDEPHKLELESFDYDNFRRDFAKLAFFRSLPYCLKGSIEFDGLSFREIAIYKISTECYYRNADYYANMNITLSDTDNNYFMVNHLNGTHQPCDQDVEIMNSFMIMEGVVDQLQQLGVYDNSTIIFTSDHGYHNEQAEFGWGATPLFLIKPPHTTQDQIVFTSTPEWHEDMMGTIAYLSGIDQDVAPKFFGDTIFDYNEDSVRTRIWYDRVYDESVPAIYSTGRLNYTTIYNAYCKYEFTGSSDCLYGKVPGSEGTEILPMTEYFG